MLKRIVNAIDRLSERTGWVVSFVVIPLCLLTVAEVVSRYWFSSPTIWSLVICTWVYGAHLVLTAAYTHEKNAHIRIDLIYHRFSPKIRAILDITTYVIFFFVSMALLTKGSIDYALDAWKYGIRLDGMFDPPLGPIRTTLAVALILFFLQGISDFIKKLFFVVKGTEL